MKAEIQVYFKSGQKFVYYIEAMDEPELASKAREHEYAILTTGYRHQAGDEHTWYPQHWIDKVKVKGVVVPTEYRDLALGT